jgi:amphiphysin
LQDAKRIFDALNVPLKEELPKLIALRTTYLEPSLEALLKLQYLYATLVLDGLKKMEGAFRGVGVSSNPQEMDRELEGAVESALSAMRELTICNMVQG